MEKSPRVTNNVFAADATLLIVETRGVAPCTVQIKTHPLQDESMFGALKQRLTRINDDTNSELVSVVLLEAKAVHPTDEKMVPHINALYHQCPKYWQALLGKVDGGGQQGRGPVGACFARRSQSS